MKDHGVVPLDGTFWDSVFYGHIMKVACEQSSGEAGKKFGERSERTSTKLKNWGSSEACSQVTVKANVVLTVTKDNKIKRSKQNQNLY